MKKLIIALIIASVLISGCVQEETETDISEENIDVTAMCIQLCEVEKEKGTDLSNGPCLSDNNPEWAITDWVCDVAHFPRQPVDNEKENQCTEFREGNANHFVEVDQNCQFIKKV